MCGTVMTTRTHAHTHWSEWLSALEMWKDQRVSGTTGSDGPFWLVEAHCDWLDDDRQVCGSRTVLFFIFLGGRVGGFVCSFLKMALIIKNFTIEQTELWAQSKEKEIEWNL